MSDQPVVKLTPPIFVTAMDGANIQIIVKHPIDGSEFIFDIVDGGGLIEDAHMLKCLLVHPSRNGPKGAGGFVLIGRDREFEVIYQKAMGEGSKRDPLQEANARIAELEASYKKVLEKVKELTPEVAGEAPKRGRPMQKAKA